MKYFINLLFLLFIKSSSLMAVYEKNSILQEVNNFLNSEKENLEYSISEKVKIPNCLGSIKIKKKYNSLKTIEIICLGEKPWKYNLRTNISEKYYKKKYKNKSKK